MSGRTRFVLNDIEIAGSVEGLITLRGDGVGIQFDGYGNGGMKDGFVVWIELVDGEVRIDVHPHINSDEPETFWMAEARESNRIPWETTHE